MLDSSMNSSDYSTTTGSYEVDNPKMTIRNANVSY